MRIGLIDYGLDVQTSITCARLADALGFSRYWFTEHHAPADPWGSAELLVATIAMVTKRVRVGTGGSLLHYHNSLRLASDFRLMSLLFPDRIDLGLARGAPLLPGNRRRLYVEQNSDFDLAAREVNRLLSDSGTVDDLSVPRALPNHPASPTVYVLGSSAHALTSARALGVCYVHGLFFGGTLETVRGLLDPDRDIVAIAGMCGVEDSHAQRSLASDVRGIVPSVVGSASECIRVMEAISRAANGAEVLFLDMSLDSKTRQRTLVQLAAERSRTEGQFAGAGTKDA